MVAVLCFAMGLPLLWFNFNTSTISPTENRMLLSPPALFDEHGNFSIGFLDAFTSYFSDNLGFRNEFLYANSTLTYYALQRSTNPRIMVGKDKWLFCNYDLMVPASLWRDYMDNTLVDDIEKVSKRVRELGPEFYFVMPPTKTFAYPEKTYYGNFDGTHVSPTRYITEELRRRGIDAHDITDDFLAAKSKTNHMLWFKYDGHWNDEGSWEGYKSLYAWLKERGEIAGELPEVSFSLAPAYRSDLLTQIYGVWETENMLLRKTENPKATRVYSGDTWGRLQALKEKYGWRDLGPNDAPFVYYQNPEAKDGKRVLLLMDSLFADLSSNVGNGSVASLLAENTLELVAVWYAYSEEQIAALIDVFQPQIVIYERTIL